MLNRLTVSALLKTVILSTAFCVVVGFLAQRLGILGAACSVTSRIAVIADASANLFKAMHNLRTDRSTTNRLLNSDQPMDAEIEKYLRGLRDAEMPAMTSALRLLPVHRIRRTEDAGAGTRSAVQDADGAAEGILGRGPQAEGLAPRDAGQGIHGYHGACCSRRWTRLSASLAAAVNHQDATIDQLLAIKQSAWLLRNTGGEASLLISNGLGRRPPRAGSAADLYEIRRRHRHRLERAGIGRDRDMQLPPALASAIAATKKAYFDPEYLALRERLLTTLIAGEKTD